MRTDQPNDASQNRISIDAKIDAVSDRFVLSLFFIKLPNKCIITPMCVTFVCVSLSLSVLYGRTNFRGHTTCLLGVVFQSIVETKT